MSLFTDPINEISLPATMSEIIDKEAFSASEAFINSRAVGFCVQV